MRPKLIGLGSPNTLRHTASTEMHRRGVPEAQIETAAGHAGDTTNKRHYRHLRPQYLNEFIDGVESMWADIGKLTQAHLRYQCDTKVIGFGARTGRGSQLVVQKQLLPVVRDAVPSEPVSRSNSLQTALLQGILLVLQGKAQIGRHYMADFCRLPIDFP